jgi:hypothetical protein
MARDHTGTARWKPLLTISLQPGRQVKDGSHVRGSVISLVLLSEIA